MTFRHQDRAFGSPIPNWRDTYAPAGTGIEVIECCAQDTSEE